MEQAKAIVKMFIGILSYLYKYRPYITVWIACCIGAGIYESIKDQNIGKLIVCMIFAAIPAAIKRILLMISRIGGRNRYDERFLKIAPRGRFMSYMDNYMTK